MSHAPPTDILATRVIHSSSHLVIYKLLCFLLRHNYNINIILATLKQENNDHEQQLMTIFKLAARKVFQYLVLCGLSRCFRHTMDMAVRKQE